MDVFFQKNPSIDWILDVDQQGRVYWLQAGESSKALAEVENVIEWLIQKDAKRNESIAVIGGGTVLDVGLFAASIYQRGVQKWSLPTTLLAAVDAGIGGKNGVNFKGFKNYIGTITQPDFVISDFRVFQTLSTLDVLNGWMEMTKHALIADPELWNTMKQFKTIPSPKAMHPLIEEAAAIKKRMVEADEFEFGLRKTLNFGHTVGHALESAAAVKNADLSHGVAVGLGMIFSLHWSATRTEHLDIQSELIDAAKSIEQWIKSGAPEQARTALQAADCATLWSCMKKDKKNDIRGVQEVSLTKIGHAVWNQPLSFSEFATCWTKAHEGV